MCINLKWKKKITTQQNNPRVADFPVNTLFLERWSPRAMSGEKLTREELMPLFEAARWAPSSKNRQPWRFLFAIKDTVFWEPFFNLLDDSQKIWARNAGALILVISRKIFKNEVRAKTHSFDTGAAWQNLSLQAWLLGYVTHEIEDFDFIQARKQLGIPADFALEAMVAIGKPGFKEDLPEELQKRERPDERIPTEEIIQEGKYDEEIGRLYIY